MSILASLVILSKSQEYRQSSRNNGRKLVSNRVSKRYVGLDKEIHISLMGLSVKTVRNIIDLVFGPCTAMPAQKRWI